MRSVVAVLLLACGSSTPSPTLPALRDAGNPKDPPTAEQCERVMAHIAELSIDVDPNDTPDTNEAKKKAVGDKLRKQGFIQLCMQGSRALAECQLNAPDQASQLKCAEGS